MENVATDEVFLDEGANVGTTSEMAKNRKGIIIGRCYECKKPVHRIYHHRGNRKVPSWIIVGDAIFHRSCHKIWKKKVERLIKKVGYGAKKIR